MPRTRSSTRSSNSTGRAAAAKKRPLVRNCSVDRTLSILSDAWSFLVLRETYLGARRFDQIQSVLRVPRSTLSDRLNRLTEAKVLYRVPIESLRGRNTGSPNEALIFISSCWRCCASATIGSLAKKAPPLKLIHTSCGHECHPETTCSACHQPIDALRVTYRDGPGAGVSPAPPVPQRRRTGDIDTFQRARPDSVSRTLSILADRWTFLVIRELFFGVRRFDAFQERLGIATNILSDRLNRLVDQCILKRVKYQKLPERHEYKLTEEGRDLYLPLIQMLRWGDQWLGHERPLILHHMDCDSDFSPVVACDYCHEPLHSHHMRYILTYKDARKAHPPALLSIEESEG